MALEQLPADLPVPEDDGAADHLLGMYVPSMELPATTGATVDLSRVGAPWAAVYVYPRTGRPGEPLPEGWEAIPGARGCTPQTCAFRDNAVALAELGIEIYGLSVQSTEYQREMVDRLGVPYPVLSDAAGELGTALRLPTMEAAGMTLYKRLTLILRNGRIERVMYPVFPPDRNAAEVATWVQARMAPKTDPAGSWNARYLRSRSLFGGEPNQFVTAELAGLSPCKVLDLGCGQGRNSLWLASQGHEVTGLDVSDVAIGQARERAAEAGLDIVFRVADLVGSWEPTPEYDVVLLSYLQLPAERRRIVHAKAVAALKPGGSLLLVAHHRDNLEHGIGGPPMPEALFAEADLAEDFATVTIERNEKVLRDVDRDGIVKTAHDVVLRATKPPG